MKKALVEISIKYYENNEDWTLDLDLEERKKKGRREEEKRGYEGLLGEPMFELHPKGSLVFTSCKGTMKKDVKETFGRGGSQ